jgi:heat shock protein HslJ
MNRTQNLLVTLLVVTAVALIACQASTPEATPTEPAATAEPTPTETAPSVESTPTQPVAPSPLEDTVWVLESYGEPGDLHAVLEGTQITARFDTEAQLSGSAGCNTYFGRFEVDGSRLSISDLAWTEMACVVDVMEQEQEYLTALQAAESYQIQEGQLQIVSAGGQALTFAAPTAGITLENTRWTLESFSVQAHFEAVLEGPEITAVFDGVEGRVSGSAGCNTYFAGYEVKGPALSVSALALTEMMCAEPAGIMEQEQKYAAALETAESYLILGGKLLIFSSGARVLTFTATEPTAATALALLEAT